MRKAIWTMIALGCGLMAAAQTTGKADQFTGQDVKARIDALEAKAVTDGSAGQTLADYGSHKVQLSVRTRSGGAEIHAHFDDIMIVQRGAATLITGGSLIDPESHADGETTGKSIRDGVTWQLGPGDVVTVNAGVPHQLLIPVGTTYAAIVIKVREGEAPTVH